MTSTIVLRDVIASDLPIFFEHQQDPLATQMAAFPARDREHFMAHWANILANPELIKQTIVFAGQVVGNIVCYPDSGKTYIGYWIDRSFWGQGIATHALRALLRSVAVRPLYAYVAAHNLASLRVLQKCGFTICSEELPDSEPQPDQVDEVLLILAAAADDQERV